MATKADSKASPGAAATQAVKPVPGAPPPAYFLSLTVENVRCFAESQFLCLTDSDGGPARWTVLLGDNGVGKTTLLECLSLLQPVQPDGEGASNQVAVRMMDTSFGALTWQRYVRRAARELAQQRSPLSTTPLWAKVAAQVRYGPVLSERRGGHVSDDLCSSADPASTGVSARAGAVDYGMLGGVVCYGYGANRNTGGRSLSNGEACDRCASLFNERVALVDPEGWLLQADYAAMKASGTQRTQIADRLEQIRDVLLRLLPDVEAITFSTPPAQMRSPRVQFRTHYGSVTIEELSLGYRAMIAWMVDLASRLFERYPDSPNPLAEPAIVLVDEIDLHMHPKWQRDIMQYLTERFPNTQFIVTAHSPLLVQAAQDANIAVLRREGDHVVIDNNPETIRGWRVDQVLTSDLFDLETARPPQVEGALAERKKLLSKTRLTKKDKARLAELEKRIGELPTGETPEDIEAMDIIRRAASELKQRGEGRDDPDQ